jgi:RND superfamily putative drug exporter
MAVMIGATIFGLGLFSSLSSNGFKVEDSESFRATQLLQTKLGDSGTDVIILLRSDTLSATDPTFTRAATSLFSDLKQRPEVDSLIDYYETQSPDLISRDGHATFAVLRLKGRDSTTKQNEYASLKPSLASQTLQVTVGGTIPVIAELTEQATHDLQQAETITLPILMLLLLLVFGGIIAASLPLFIGVLTILGTFAVLRGFTTVTDVSVYAINVVTMLGLGLAIDYSLFILSRFREELVHNQQEVRTALERTMATAGRTVIFSALTVSTSLLSLLLFPMSLMRSISLGAISAVLVAMLLSITLLPLILALLGPRVNALSFRRFIRFRRSSSATNTREQEGVWYRLSERIMRRPVLVTTALVILLASLVIPFLHIKLATSGIEFLPADNETRVVSQKISQDFAHQGNAQLVIAVTTPGNALSPENLASLDSYVKSIQAIPGVIQVQSLVTVSPDLNLSAYQQLYAHPELDPRINQVVTNLANDDLTKITVAIQPADHTSAATTLVEQIRALQAPGGLTALVTGITPDESDLLAGIAATLPQALLLIFASIFVLLFLMTGSLVMPLKAIILNMLSLSATFGGLVWIFQDGHLQDILHFQSLGNIEATQPVLIFAIAFGLSMDYEVFVLSRIKERFDETGNNRLAVSSGIQSTGWLITSAALLMAVVQGGFGTARMLSIQEVGIGLAIAVIMDATIIRMLLLPATMHLLGSLNWWAPAPLRSLWQRIGLKETALSPALAFHAQGNLAPVASGMRNEILTDTPYRTMHYAEPVESPPNSEKAAPQRSVIWTRTAVGKEIMGPDILLWCYPEKHIVDGSMLIVKSNQFCILKGRDTILNVYEAGQHKIQTPDDPLSDSTQLTFNGEPIPLEYEVIYINRAQLAVQASGVALSREKTRVDYSVDYAIHIATREDAIRLVQSMPSLLGQDQSLHIRDVNAYIRPGIERILNQLAQVTPLGHGGSNQEQQMQDLSQLMHERLQPFLSTYGITVDTVKVRVASRDQDMKAALSLKDLGLSELDVMRHYADTTNNLTGQRPRYQQELPEQEVYMIWQNRLNRYTDEIATLQAELESIRADFDLRMDTHSARLQELSRVISTDSRANALDLNTSGASPQLTVLPESGISDGTTGQAEVRQAR